MQCKASVIPNQAARQLVFVLIRMLTLLSAFLSFHAEGASIVADVDVILVLLAPFPALGNLGRHGLRVHGLRVHGGTVGRVAEFRSIFGADIVVNALAVDTIFTKFF